MRLPTENRRSYYPRRSSSIRGYFSIRPISKRRSKIARAGGWTRTASLRYESKVLDMGLNIKWYHIVIFLLLALGVLLSLLYSGMTYYMPYLGLSFSVMSIGYLLYLVRR